VPGEGGAPGEGRAPGEAGGGSRRAAVHQRHHRPAEGRDAHPRALLANLEQSAALDPSPITGADTVLLALPLFHVYGLNPGLGMVARPPPPGCWWTLRTRRGRSRCLAAERVAW